MCLIIEEIKTGIESTDNETPDSDPINISKRVLDRIDHVDNEELNNFRLTFEVAKMVHKDIVREVPDKYFDWLRVITCLDLIPANEFISDDPKGN